MTDNEIIKALECCADSQHCWLCVLRDKEDDCHKLEKYALDLINRQQAEIERLQNLTEKDFEQTAISTVERHRKWIEYRTIKEFAERFLKKVHDNHYLLVDRINSKDYGMFTIGIEQAVDETKKEMVGEDK